jgi:hypothetical protein
MNHLLKFYNALPVALIATAATPGTDTVVMLHARHGPGTVDAA